MTEIERLFDKTIEEDIQKMILEKADKFIWLYDNSLSRYCTHFDINGVTITILARAGFTYSGYGDVIIKTNGNILINYIDTDLARKVEQIGKINLDKKHIYNFLKTL